MLSISEICLLGINKDFFINLNVLIEMNTNNWITHLIDFRNFITQQAVYFTFAAQKTGQTTRQAVQSRQVGRRYQNDDSTGIRRGAEGRDSNQANTLHRNKEGEG